MRKLIFTHSGNFKKQFGQSSLTLLRTRLDALRQFDQGRGLDTRVLYVDEDDSARALGIGSATIPTPDLIKKVIDEASGKQPYDYFLIIGGQAIVPMFTYPNPVADDDRSVPSDNGYCITESTAKFGPYFVERALGRLPTGADEGPDVLWKQIDEIMSFQPVQAKTFQSVALSAAFWETPSRNIAVQLGIADADLHFSPPIDLDASSESLNPEWVADRRLQYFNLHGIPFGPKWLGERDPSTFPTAYQPSVVPSRIQHAIIASEACYGGDIIGTPRVPRTVNGAVCLTCLDRQAVAFCGSSTIAYGGTNKNPSLLGADLLTLYFLQGVRSGMAQGDAFLYAKAKLASDKVQQKRALDAVTQKSLLQFCLYGDPSIVPLSGPVDHAKTIPAGYLDLVQQAKSRQLSGVLHGLQAEVVPWDDAGKVQSTAISEVLTQFSEWKPVHVARSSHKLSWRGPSRGKVVPSGRTGVAAAMMPQTFQEIWHTDVFAIGPMIEGYRQFLICIVTKPIEPRVEVEQLLEVAVSR